MTEPNKTFWRTIDYPFSFAKRPIVNITSNDGAGWLLTLRHPPYNDNLGVTQCTIAVSVMPNDYLPISMDFGVHIIGE